MKVEKMLDKLKNILSADRKIQIAKYTSLKKVLKSLRIEKKKLEKELQEAVDEETKHEISSRLKVISMQRKKGLKVLKELKIIHKQRTLE